MPHSSILLFGNPGAGKSALLNILVGKATACFKSGTSAEGTGVTKKLKHCHVDGVTYIDVPGLADLNLKGKASEAIREALLRAGDSASINFVVGHDDGRIREQDTTSVREILASCPAIGRQYGVIVNRVSEKMQAKMRASGWEAEFMKEVPEARRSTRFIYLPEVPALKEMEWNEVDWAQNPLRQNFGELFRFIDAGPPCSIPQESVGTTETRTVGQQQAEARKASGEIQELRKEMKRRDDRDARFYAGVAYVAGAGATIAGIALAPFTGGISLGASTAAGAYTGAAISGVLAAEVGIGAAAVAHHAASPS